MDDIDDQYPLGRLNYPEEVKDFNLSKTDAPCRWCGCALLWENDAYLKCSGVPSCDEVDEGSPVGKDAYNALSGSVS